MGYTQMSWQWTMTSHDQYATAQNTEDTICLTAGGNKLKINLFIQTESSRTLKGMFCFVLINSEVVTFFDIQCKKLKTWLNALLQGHSALKPGEWPM